VIVYFAIPIFWNQPTALLWVLLWAFSQGMSPMWYFQGIEKIILPAFIEIVGRIFPVLALIFFVKNSQDIILVLGIQTIPSFVSSFVLNIMMYRTVKFTKPTQRTIQDVLIKGFSMFFYRISISLYTSANVFILGALSGPLQAGYFAAAERFVATVNGGYWPFWRSIFPRISYYLSKDRTKAVQLSILTMKFALFYGTACALLIYILAPSIVSLFLGPKYDAVVSILQILAISIPFIGIAGTLGLHWMIPNQIEKEFNFITLGSGVVNITLAFSLIKSFGAKAMAGAVVIAEVFAVIAMIMVMYKKGILFK
jgi:polysaccharide transporter, PST family